MMRSKGVGGATAEQMASYHAARKPKGSRGQDGGIYTAEMGPPPQDIDMGSSPKPVRKAKGGSIDGCARKGKTKGRYI